MMKYFLMTLKNFLTILLVLSIGILVWNVFSPETFYYAIASFLTNADTFWSERAVVMYFSQDLNPYFFIEAALLLYAVYWLIIKQNIRALFRIRVIFFVTLSVLWLNFILFNLLGIANLRIWEIYQQFLLKNALFTTLFVFWGNIELFSYVLFYLVIFAIGRFYVYIISTKGLNRQSGVKLDPNDPKKLEIDELVKKARKLTWGAIPKRIRFTRYVSNAPNAYTYSGKKVAFSTALADSTMFSQETFNAVIAHELGHIKNKDGEVKILVETATLLIYLPLQIFSDVTDLIVSVIPKLKAIPLLSNLLEFLIKTIVDFVKQISRILGGKIAENKADAFAVDMQLGQGLIDFFTTMGIGKEKFFDRFTDEHPTSKKRVKNINSRMKFYGSKKDEIEDGEEQLPVLE